MLQFIAINYKIKIEIGEFDSVAHIGHVHSRFIYSEEIKISLVKYRFATRVNTIAR